MSQPPKRTVFWLCILNAKLLLVCSGYCPRTFLACLRVLGGPSQPWGDGDRRVTGVLFPYSH